jgi:hypothetical protein
VSGGEDVFGGETMSSKVEAKTYRGKEVEVNVLGAMGEGVNKGLNAVVVLGRSIVFYRVVDYRQAKPVVKETSSFGAAVKAYNAI